ncbi:sugar phosphate isomerase/epimerase family protein [Agreia sp.]|uniref:sugar phosphate isomerase/epimerase family protein n=1 Tax=Agreia sp. TaxID=1872416 RepID=UPI0035BBB52E
MSYSVQLYSLRDAIEADLPGTIAKVASIGFTQVEPYNFAATADELNAALKENGLTAPSGHAPLLTSDQDVIFAAAQRLGIATVIEPLRPAEHWQRLEDIRETAELLNAAAVKAAGYGIRVGYHNHAWELESVIDGKTALEHFVTYLAPEIVLEVDTYWVTVGGQDAVEILTLLGDRVRFIHIKDGPATQDTSLQVPAGQGSIPVRDVLEAAKALEVGVVEFDDYAGDVFEGIAESLAFLQKPSVTA